MRHDIATGDLFYDIPRAAPALPASMDFRPQLSHLVSEMLAHAASDQNINRFQIAARASTYAGREISVSMLNGYTSEKREAFNLPLWIVPALECACESILLTDWLARIRGGRVLLGPAALDAEIGRMERMKTDAADQLKQLRHLRRKVR